MRCTLRALLVSCLFWLVLPMVHADANKAPQSPETVKKLYLYNFFKYVEWPSTNPLNKGGTAIVCSMGLDNLTRTLEGLEQLSSPDLMIEVNVGVTAENISKCHVLYLAESLSRSYSGTLLQLQDKPILTVSSITDFAPKGGMIGFIPDKKVVGLIETTKVAFEVNTKSSGQSAIKIKADMLGVAKKVYDK